MLQMVIKEVKQIFQKYSHQPQEIIYPKSLSTHCTKHFISSLWLPMVIWSISKYYPSAPKTSSSHPWQSCPEQTHY